MTNDYEFHVTIEDVTDLTTDDAKEINNAISDAVYVALGEQDIDADGVSVNVSAPEIDGHKTGHFSTVTSPETEDDDE